MKWKPFAASAVLILLFSIVLTFFGCGEQPSISAAAEETLARLPFTVPRIFTYNEEATNRNRMLTYTSDAGTTLILSCNASSRESLARAKGEEITEPSLVVAYRNAGLEVGISHLKQETKKDSLRYTYTVRMTNQYGTTVTRKYIFITEDYALDISCGGSEGNVDLIDEDYAAILFALREGEVL